MKKNLNIKAKLIKNNNSIYISYDAGININNSYNNICNSYIDKLQILLGKLNICNIKLNNKHIKNINETLSNFGCTDEEIKNLTNIAEFKTVNPEDLIFKLSDSKYYNAKLILDDIINGRNRELTDNQKRLLNDEFKYKITYNEYIELSKTEQNLYNIYPYNYKCIQDTIKFLNTFITKYKNNIEYINIEAYLYTDSFDPQALLYIKTEPITQLKLDNDTENHYSITFKKSYKPKHLILTEVNNVPLIELHPEFKTAFTEFEEDRFSSNLIPDIFKEFDKNVITTYRCTQTKELADRIQALKETAKNAILNNLPNPLTTDEIRLINKSTEIIYELDEIPNDYKISSVHIKQLKPQYYHKLNKTQNKFVNTTDILYLLNYITNI